MKVRLAKKAGFCMGVRRAMEIALEASYHHPDPIYTHGPLIHNPQVLRVLEKKGITVLDAAGSEREGTVIVRAHGIPPQEFERLDRSGFTVIDATCPRVIKVQAIIRKYFQEGYTPIIVGDQEHPEVIGLLGFAPGRGIVVSGLDQVGELPPDLERVIVVAQTTQDETLFQEVVETLRQRYPEVRVFQTICNATRERQAEVKQLARETEALVVVGGFNSGNTRRLVGIAQAAGKPCLHVETEEELDREALRRFRNIGVTAGASTPNWMIRKVVQELEAIPGSGESRFRSGLFRTVRLLLKSNLLVALGAACLSLVASRLRQVPLSGLYFTVTFLHIFAMHILNHLLDTEAAEYNDPDRSLLYQRHRPIFMVSGTAAALGSLLLTYSLGWPPFLLLTAMTALGILYSIRIVPAVWQHFSGLKKIKDIPASKSLSVALGWGGVTTLIPALAERHWSDPGTIVIFFLLCSLVYIRSGLFDILDIQGDLIVGKETLPILIGEDRTLRLLKGLGFGVMAGMILFYLIGVFPPFALSLLVSTAYLQVLLVFFEKKRMLTGGIFFEAMVESNFILAGIFALVVP